MVVLFNDFIEWGFMVFFQFILFCLFPSLLFCPIFFSSSSFRLLQVLCVYTDSFITLIYLFQYMYVVLLHMRRY